MREDQQPGFQQTTPSGAEVPPEFHEYGLALPDHFIFEGQHFSLVDLIVYMGISLDDRADRRGSIDVYSEKKQKYQAYIDEQPNMMGMPDYERSQRMMRAYFDQCRIELKATNKKVTFQDIAQMYVATRLDPAAQESNPYLLARGFDRKKIEGEDWRLIIEEFLTLNAESDRLYDFLQNSHIMMGRINEMEIGRYSRLRDYLFEREISYDKLVALRVNNGEIPPASIESIENIFYPGVVPELREFAGNNIPIIMSANAVADARNMQRYGEDEIPNYGDIYESMGISPQVQTKIKDELGESALKEWIISQFVNDIKYMT